MYPHHVFDLEPAGTFGMYPICYWQVSGGYLQPEPAMYSRCFCWFPGPLAPSATFKVEVPLPDTEAVDSLWNDIFCPVPKITWPFPSDIRCPKMLGLRINAPTTQVVRETVSLFDSSGGRFEYSPGSLQAHTIPANEAATGKGTQDEPFNADAWITMLEFATGVGPSPADVALRQKSPDVSHGGKKDGEGGEERERNLGVKTLTVSHSKL